MLLAIATKSEVVRKPSHLQQLGYRALRISENLRTESQRSPSAKEIAQVINRQRAGTKTPPVDGDRVSDALAAVRAHTVSGETPLGNSPDSDTIFSRLVDTHVSDPSGADSSHNYSSVISLVQGLMGILSSKEREVVRLRLPVDPQESPLTLEEIGGRFNYTRERIRQIEASALKKLRDALERRGIKGSTVF
jgi:RNA polymerase primary sigma factor